MKKALEEENINNIYCFMNIIFDEVNNLIKNSKGMKTPEERKEFENEFNQMINTCVQNLKGIKTSEEIKESNETINTENYNHIKLSENYLKICNIYEGTNKDPVLGFPPNSEELYPYLYDLFPIKTVSKEGIYEIIKTIENASDLYPVLTNYLETDEKSIEYLQNINLMNEFVLFTIENYSYQIDRKTANVRKMVYEVNNGKIPKKAFENFKKAFNDNGIYLKDLQYDCHPLTNIVEKQKLDENKYPSIPLSSFLIDNGDYGQGMKIAAVYQDFIKIQNTFLQNIKPKIDKIERLKYLVKNMEEKIPPQKAKKCNIISFNIASENYNSFTEMLLLHSYKDIYGNVKYDLNSIENELEIILLPEKKILDDNIYVIYQYESFSNYNSSIIPQFCENFPQIELSDDEKQFLYNFINNQDSNDSNKKILFSIQLIIFYLRDKNDREIYKNKTLKKIINDNILPNYIHLSKETMNLFNTSDFTIFNLFSVYEYFELLCYDDFKNNTIDDYNIPIPEDKVLQLNQYFENKEKKGKGYLITKLILSSSVRKFISRFLSGKRNTPELNPSFELFLWMKERKDIWKIETRENANFDIEISELIEINILVENAVNLYDVLGGDKILLGEEVNQEIEIRNKEETEENRERTDEEINTRGNKKKRKNKEIIF